MYDPWKTLGVLVSCFYLSLMSFPYLKLVWERSGVRRWGSMANERGQGLVEYALILVLVAVVVIAVLLLLGPSIKNIF
jgi:pilus assembly protein Flp/PilA